MARKRSPSPPPPPPLLFSKGDMVEVSWDEARFKGFWFEAQVVRVLRKTRRYVVKFDAVVNYATSRPLRQTVVAACVRPRPPRLDACRFDLRQPVEAFFASGWRPGVVSRVLREAEGEGRMYAVCFRDPTVEEVAVRESCLRPQLEWSHWEWVLGQSQVETTAAQELLNIVVDSATSLAAVSKSLPHSEAGKEAKTEALLPLGDQVPDAAGIDGRNNTAQFEETKADIHPDRSTSEERCLPFVKSSSMWNSIESLEVFSLMKQQPHFRPLEQHFEDIREGMAIGLMVAFANLVDSIGKLQIFEPNSNFEAKVKIIAHLEEHGFNIQPLKARLGELLRIKGSHKQIQDNISALEGLISERENQKNLLSAKVEAIDKSIEEVENRLNLLNDEKASIQGQSEEIDCEISKLKMDAKEANESLLAAEKGFKGALAAGL